MVNQQTLEGNWNEISGKLQKKWGQLTDDELRQVKGNQDQIVGLIQRKTGETRDAIERYLNEITAQGSSRASQAAEAARGYAHEASERVAQASERISEQVREGYGQAERMLHDRPAESLAVMFGIGVITGVVVGLALRR